MFAQKFIIQLRNIPQDLLSQMSKDKTNAAGLSPPLCKEPKIRTKLVDSLLDSGDTDTA
jgi:hypothetical protein